MSLVKVIEVIAQSEKSWEDAAQEAVRIASETIEGIQHVYVKEFQVIVENNQVTLYRVNAKVSFLVKEKLH
jgi:flavin-binding protein dodecin